MENSSQKTSRTLTAGVKAGGCAAKLSSAELHQILTGLSLRGSDRLLTSMENFEDAAVYKISEDLAIVQTIDFFPPMLDDPYLFGKIAATNALSDIYAMGGTPMLAMNILCFPTCDYPLDVAAEILRGGADQVHAAGSILVGGHSIQSSEAVYGLAVTGFIHPGSVLTNSGVICGDTMVLCKSIGTGVALLGLKANSLSPAATETLLDTLTTLNSNSLQVALKYELNALTDITGFGLIGHIHEMSKASGLSAHLQADKISFLPEVRSLAEQGFVPAGAYANRNSYEKSISYIDEIDQAIMDLLFDPQTAGGLLMSVAPEKAEALCAALESQGVSASSIGTFENGTPGRIKISHA